MSDLQGARGEVRATIQVTRKDTGKVDVFDVIGHVHLDPQQPIKEEGGDVSHSLDSGA